MADSALLARADGLRAARTPFVLATVVRAEKPTSAKAGDRAILLADGTIDGFVGGVCAESTVRVEGLRLLGEAPGSSVGASTLLRITPVDGGFVDAMSAEVSAEMALANATELERREGMVVVANPCLSGGTLDIFLEAVLPPALVHIFGAAPIARSLAAVAAASGYAVTATTDPSTPIAADTAAVVVASHGRDEERVLAAALAAGVGYVGLVASRRRGAAVVADLAVPPEQRARVRTPAGLDLGARTPSEVAVSIVAELVSVRAAARPAGLGAPGVAAWAANGGAPAMAVDPVCGMSVAAVPASLQVEHDGVIWYFCGPGCVQAFIDDPGRYGA